MSLPTYGLQCFRHVKLAEEKSSFTLAISPSDGVLFLDPKDEVNIFN